MLSQNELEKIIQTLKEGGVVAFPTDTVYALAADAKNVQAIRRIYALKRRPFDQPLSVLITDRMDWKRWACDISEEAQKLAAAFWPGPLTLICKKQPHVLPILTAQGDTVGVRIPNHPIAQAILSAFGSGLAAPSANLSGASSATTTQQVQAAFAEQVREIVPGECTLGVESTIVDTSTSMPTILRIGAFSEQRIAQIVRCKLSLKKMSG